MINLHSHSPAKFVDIGRLATGALERSLLSTEHRGHRTLLENVDFHRKKRQTTLVCTVTIPNSYSLKE